MDGVLLNRDELRDRIFGCWTGKNIGGTLGGPFEGRREILDVQGYTTPPGEPLPNDDLDLQLVWLKAVQDRGPWGVDARVLGEYWLNYIPPHWNEYGIGKANQRLGLAPPLSGMYRNPWKHSNGAWIRSEIWACLAPGWPDAAVRYAYEDACVDHGAGEGTTAALFCAAVESAAFVVADRDELIRIGLSKIPPSSRVARAVDVVRKAYSEGRSWQEAREAVVEDSSDLGWFQAPANVAFFVIGWLWGEGDFGRSLRIAVGCGDDTDCTGATLGAILGIRNGRSGIPGEWIEPIGDRIVTKAIDIGSFTPPRTVVELTDQVMELIPGSLAAARAPVALTETSTDLSALDALDLAAEAAASDVWRRSPYSIVHDMIHARVVLDHGREPEVMEGEPHPVRLRFTNLLPDRRSLELRWLLPDGWIIRPADRMRVDLDSYLTSIGSIELLAGGRPDTWPPVTEVEVEIIPGPVTSVVERGVLEIVAPGRPTVGLVPLVFLDGRTRQRTLPE